MTPYDAGKLVDQSGQGSTNDNYGFTLQVLPQPAATDPGNVYGNPRAALRLGDLLVFGLGAALFAVAGPAAAEKHGKRRTKKRKREESVTRVIGAVVMGAAVVGVAARWISPNFDAASSMIPGNVSVV